MGRNLSREGTVSARLGSESGSARSLRLGKKPGVVQPPPTPSPWRGGRLLASLDNGALPLCRELRQSTRSCLAREVVPEGVAKRRRASSVPSMRPKCVRVFSVETTRNDDLQAFIEAL